MTNTVITDNAHLIIYLLGMLCLTIGFYGIIWSIKKYLKYRDEKEKKASV